MWSTHTYLLLRGGPGANLSFLCESEDVECLEPGASCLPPPSSSTTPEDPLQNSTDPLLDSFYSWWPVEEWPYFTREYLLLLNRHWLAYPPPSHQAHLIMLAVYACIGVVGFTGNAVVIFMMASVRALRTPSNLLVMNLALSDLLMMSKTPLFLYNSYHRGPALGSLGCTLYGFIGGMTGTCSIMTLAAIALDRYYVIAYPLNRDFHTTRRRAIIWIVLIWIYSIGFSTVPIADIGIKTYVPEGYLTSCSFDYLDSDPFNKYFILGFFVAAWVVPFLIICLSYAGICRAVLVVSMATRMGQEKEKRKKEIKLAVVVIMVVAVWFAAWTPYATVALLGVFGKKDLITPTVSMVPAIFCKTAACVDPFLYSLNHPRLRSELFRIFCPSRYEMYRIETQKSLYNLKESSRSSLNLKEIKARSNRPEEMELEDVGEPWKKHKGNLSQSGTSLGSESLKSEVMTM